MERALTLVDWIDARFRITDIVVVGAPEMIDDREVQRRKITLPLASNVYPGLAKVVDDDTGEVVLHFGVEKMHTQYAPDPFILLTGQCFAPEPDEETTR